MKTKSSASPIQPYVMIRQRTPQRLIPWFLQRFSLWFSQWVSQRVSRPLLLEVMLGIVFLSVPLTLKAQDGLNALPGYIDFSQLEERFSVEPSLEVNIQGQLLLLVAEASREDDPELADLLNRLSAIQVRGFPMRRTQFRHMESQSEDIARQLEEEGWNTVVKLRDFGQYVDVYARENDDFIEGLMMMVVDRELQETVFINIVGDIRADELGRIGSRFDIAPLEEVANDR